MTQTVSGLFDNYADASAAVTRLEQAGISQDNINIVGKNGDAAGVSEGTAEGAGAGASVGTVVGGGAGLLAGLGLLAIPGVGPVVAAGALVATLTGAGVGAAAGGLVGSLTGMGVSEDHAHVYAEGVRRGGTLVTATVADDRASAARDILSAGKAVNPGDRRASYETEGWTGFDPAAPAYNPEVAKDRPTLPRNDAGVPPTA